MRAKAQAQGPVHTARCCRFWPCLLPVPGVGTVLGLGMAALASMVTTMQRLARRAGGNATPSVTNERP